MSPTLFVTGMVRSGTPPVREFLDECPDLVVAYQPFHRFLVDLKQRFLDTLEKRVRRNACERFLPRPGAASDHAAANAHSLLPETMSPSLPDSRQRA